MSCDDKGKCSIEEVEEVETETGSSSQLQTPPGAIDLGLKSETKEYYLVRIDKEPACTTSSKKQAKAIVKALTKAITKDKDEVQIASFEGLRMIMYKTSKTTETGQTVNQVQVTHLSYDKIGFVTLLE